MTTGATLLSDSPNQRPPGAVFLPLGDSTLLVRFGDRLTEEANTRAINAALALCNANLAGVEEVTPNLISVALRYDPAQTGFMELCGKIRLALSNNDQIRVAPARVHIIDEAHIIEVDYGGQAGQDLEAAASYCKLSPPDFIKAHNQAVLRVLATGFAPGFVYCGLHQPHLHIPRRQKIHAHVAPGSILFAAGQTAIVATPVPTGWHVIGRTDFCNFQPDRDPPTLLGAGDMIRFSGEFAP